MNRYDIFKVFLIMLLFVGAGCGPDKKAGGHMGGFPVNVVAEPVKAEKIEDKISLVGNLRADESVEIKNQIAGVIEEIGFTEGQMVTQGQVLFKIDAAKLKASLAQAQAGLTMSQTTFDRLSILIKSNAISQQEYDQSQSDLQTRKAEIELINAQIKETTIMAPFDGVMGERTVSMGQFVNQGTTLTYLIQQNPMKAEFRVPERFLGQLKEGQGIEVTVAAYPNENFTGEVYFIDPQVDELTRTALVKAKLPNPEGKLKRGMFANLNLIVSIREQALTVPETALIPKSDEVYVYVIDAENKAQMKKVKVGVRLVGKAEIIEGINAGENVIVEGYQKIGPGSLVNTKK